MNAQEVEVLIENDFEEKANDGSIYKRNSYIRVKLEDKLGNSDEFRNKVLKRLDGKDSEW
jgi:hypothetical protein